MPLLEVTDGQLQRMHDELRNAVNKTTLTMLLRQDAIMVSFVAEAQPPEVLIMPFRWANKRRV